MFRCQPSRWPKKTASLIKKETLQDEVSHEDLAIRLSDTRNLTPDTYTLRLGALVAEPM